MKKPSSNDNKNQIDSAVEQWVRLLLAHIEAKKQIINTQGKKYKEKAN